MYRTAIYLSRSNTAACFSILNTKHYAILLPIFNENKTMQNYPEHSFCSGFFRIFAGLLDLCGCAVLIIN